MVSPSDAVSGAQLPARVQTYIEALVQTWAQDRVPLVSVVLFGSAAKGGFTGEVSDVDLILVVPDDASRATRRRLGGDVAPCSSTSSRRPETDEGTEAVWPHRCSSTGWVQPTGARSAAPGDDGPARGPVPSRAGVPIPRAPVRLTGCPSVRRGPGTPGFGSAGSGPTARSDARR